jgi:hypothetical protein
MSTIPYGPNDQYLIGTNGTELPWPSSIFEGFKNLITRTYAKMIPDIIVPTYGLWGGPGWTGDIELN